MQSKKKMQIALLCILVIVVIFFIVLLIISSLSTYFTTLLPTKSVENKLDVATYGTGECNPVITIKHYNGGVNAEDYVLDIDGGVFGLDPQSYVLPEIEGGSAEVVIKLRGEITGTFSLFFNNTEDLYKKGLLLYLADFKGVYMYMISGKDRVCYSKASDSDKWELTMDAPSPKSLPPKHEKVGYLGLYSGWKENKWVVNKITS